MGLPAPFFFALVGKEVSIQKSLTQKVLDTHHNKSAQVFSALLSTFQLGQYESVESAQHFWLPLLTSAESVEKSV